MALYGIYKKSTTRIIKVYHTQEEAMQQLIDSLPINMRGDFVVKELGEKYNNRLLGKYHIMRSESGEYHIFRFDGFYPPGKNYKERVANHPYSLSNKSIYCYVLAHTYENALSIAQTAIDLYLQKQGK